MTRSRIGMLFGVLVAVVYLLNASCVRYFGARLASDADGRPTSDALGNDARADGAGDGPIVDTRTGDSSTDGRTGDVISPVTGEGWTLMVGGTGAVAGWGVAINKASPPSLALGGHFSGTMDLDPGPQVDNHTAQGTNDLFIMQVDVHGQRQWGRVLSGDADATVYAVGTARDGSVVATGQFTGTLDCDPGPGTQTLAAQSSGDDIFLVKLDSDGNLVWCHGWINSPWNIPQALQVADDGTVYLGGIFRGTMDFDPGAGTASRTATDAGAFLLKLSSAGSFQWVYTFDGPNHDAIYAATLDAASQDIIVGGVFQNTVDFDDTAGEDIHTGSSRGSAVLVRLDGQGKLVWTRTFGGTGTAMAAVYGAAVAGDRTYITGTFSGTVDFDPGPGTLNQTSAGTSAFVTAITSAGVHEWSRFILGGDIVWGNEVAASSQGCVVGGFFGGEVDFDPGSGTALLNAGVRSDGFIVRLDRTGAYQWARHIGPDAGATNDVVLYDEDCFAVGHFEGSVDFDHGPAQHILTPPNGNTAAFATRLNAHGLYR